MGSSGEAREARRAHELVLVRGTRPGPSGAGHNFLEKTGALPPCTLQSQPSRPAKHLFEPHPCPRTRITPIAPTSTADPRQQLQGGGGEAGSMLARCGVCQLLHIVM
ncbi:MAG: hypothetical protein WDW38_008140 [Sanguina aurantia]